MEVLRTEELTREMALEIIKLLHLTTFPFRWKKESLSRF